MILHHGIFQGYNFFHHIGMDRNMRDMFKDHANYDQTAEFVELYDNLAFNPKTEPIADLGIRADAAALSMAQPKNTIGTKSVKEN